MLFLNIFKKNTSRRVLFFCIIIFSVIPCEGMVSFTMNDECIKAQADMYALKFDEAEKILKNEALKDPENIAVPWLSESIVFLKIFISEDKEVYKQQNTHWNNLVDKMRKVEFNNAWYRFVLSDMYLHKGLIKLKFNETFSAGSDLKTAYKYLKENRKMFPSFLPDNKNYGLLACAFSSVPSKYQWLAKLIGFQGDMNTGLREIEDYLNSGLTTREHEWLRVETAFIYALVQHHLNKNTEVAWKHIEPYTRNYKNNLIINYMRATIAGYVGKNDEMIDILSHKPSYQSNSPFYYMDFLLGLAKMRRLDTDADVYFKIFTVKYKGSNYVKSAFRYLSWLSLVKNDRTTALTYYSLCSKHGVAIIEEDKQAEKEAAENVLWPAELIKARLLFDGKYYDKSMALLNGIQESSLSNIRFKLEYHYRKARIHHEKHEYASAISLYMQVMESGKLQTYYFAAYSALQLAYIYEKQGKTDLAITYFKKAKDDFSKNLEYNNSIEQKAKAGLKRLEK
jgi:tetratricopeptide (TPR) repeat protein